MTIFLALATYLIVVHIAIPESDKMKKSIWAASGFVLILALRSPFCGLDVTGTAGTILPNSYGGVFFNISHYSLWEIIQNSASVNSHMEVGWLLLTKFISFFTSSLQLFLVIIAILQFVPITYLIGKYSRNVVLSFFVFVCLGFYIHYFSGLRQFFAVSLLLLAFDALYCKRLIKFVIIVFFASTIHTSALIFLIMWPLSKLKLSVMTCVVVILVLLLSMPLYKDIVSGVLSAFFESRYDSYLDSEGSALTMFVVYSIFLLLSFLIKADSPLVQYLRVFILVGVVSQSLGILGTGAVTRIGFYFNIFFMLLLPEILEIFETRIEREIVFVAAIILLCTFFVFTNNSQNSLGVIPYQFFWENPVG